MKVTCIPAFSRVSVSHALRVRLLAAALSLIAACGEAREATAPIRPGSSHPALSALSAPGATLELLAVGMPGRGTGNWAFAVNERGQVVGSSMFPPGLDRAVVWDNGSVVNLGTLPDDGDERTQEQSQAYAVNNLGHVAGIHYNEDGERAFIWRDGVMRELPALSEGESTTVTGINDRGQVVGASVFDRQLARGVLWENGVATDLGRFLPLAINNRGQMVGSCRDDAGSGHPCIWEAGSLTMLNVPAPAHARDINDHGEVVGTMFLGPDQQHAFLWRDGTLTDLTPGARFADGVAVSNSGIVAGRVSVPEGGQRAFAWRDGTLELLPHVAGEHVGDAEVYGANDRGEIVGALVTEVTSLIFPAVWRLAPRR
jgi:probable HAF family extracellular repeat protein